MQLSLLEDQQANTPAGLVYLPDFLSPEEEAGLTDCILAGEWPDEETPDPAHKEPDDAGRCSW
ncbi:hypothetical protein [Candidatus Poriferisodalis sp.]|uniref:hypothetical protein n=1 Tax=Candidatus Poriferisodalis sp. TaxID=3101277 RepID=UPI003B02B080